MDSRSHIHEELFDASADEMFDLLITPSAIRGWWGASRAIVDAREDGIWTAAWGDEDDPDYISTATLVEFDPPRKLAMKYGRYFAKSGPLPFEFAEDAMTVFRVEPSGDGCILRVEQTGFPCDAVADEFYAACETGWRNTFEGIRAFLQDGYSEDDLPDPPLTPHEEYLVSQLTVEQVEEIDQALLANSSIQWRKVARVAGGAMCDLNDRVVGIPDIYYARRIRKLIGHELLEVSGNIDYIRYCEIRLLGSGQEG